MIQSVFGHSQLLIGQGFHAPVLGNVLVEQTIEVHVAAALPNAIRIGKVSLDTKALMNCLVTGKLIAVVDRQILHPGAQGQELGLNGSAEQLSRLLKHLRKEINF